MGICIVFLQDKKLGEISFELERNLHELSQQCVTFKDRVNHFVGSHKRNRKTLQHHMQLVELLEVPQLVDACARNGFHDEALELANFVNGLERRHLLASEVKSLNGKLRGGSGVIQTIVDDVHRTLAGLRQQLLQQLTENTALPKEISVLATLRKLDGLLIDRHLSLGRYEADSNNNKNNSSGIDAEAAGMAMQRQRDQLRQQLAQSSEVRLQMDFLEARTIWLHRSAERSLHTHRPAAAAGGGGGADGGEDQATNTSTTSRISTTGASASAVAAALGPYGKAIEMLEIRRTAWFAVMTQFNALVLENNNSISSSAGGGSGSSYVSKGKAQDGSSSAAAQEFSLQRFSPAIVLNAWATRQVSQLLRELQALLPYIDDGASLRSVLEQTLFFAARMGQVGCDFSGLATPLFQEVMVGRFCREVGKAAENFKVMLLTERISFDADGDTLFRDQV